ncbi:MAG: hypothetical protein PHY43_02215 [Verrucomicrobiales bacterium]|nr:hypothetical protein [Verrucomicrobiales bacterium]
MGKMILGRLNRQDAKNAKQFQAGKTAMRKTPSPAFRFPLSNLGSLGVLAVQPSAHRLKLLLAVLSGNVQNTCETRTAHSPAAGGSRPGEIKKTP